MKTIVRQIAVILGALLVATCSLFPSRFEPIEILVKGSGLTLAWDPPEYAGSYAGSEAVSYRVYYRARGATSWTELQEMVADTSPSLTITSEDLDYGYYEFAVSTVNKAGKESSLHASTETSADPKTGWYVNWIGSR